jgi:GNAT superfamily N-acetyltransferase
LWNVFRKYHYLNHELNRSARCHALIYEGRAIGFCATLHSPHPKSKNLKRCSRLVVLPDYQGVGIGIRFLNIVAGYFNGLGFRYLIRTSQRNVMKGLGKSESWRLIGYGKNTPFSAISAWKEFNRTISASRVTACYEFRGSRS